jgi:hypothetical protein
MLKAWFGLDAEPDFESGENRQSSREQKYHFIFPRLPQWHSVPVGQQAATILDGLLHTTHFEAGQQRAMLMELAVALCREERSHEIFPDPIVHVMQAIAKSESTASSRAVLFLLSLSQRIRQTVFARMGLETLAQLLHAGSLLDPDRQAFFDALMPSSSLASGQLDLSWLILLEAPSALKFDRPPCRSALEQLQRFRGPLSPANKTALDQFLAVSTNQCAVETVLRHMPATREVTLLLIGRHQDLSTAATGTAEPRRDSFNRLVLDKLLAYLNAAQLGKPSEALCDWSVFLPQAAFARDELLRELTKYLQALTEHLERALCGKTTSTAASASTSAGAAHPSGTAPLPSAAVLGLGRDLWPAIEELLSHLNTASPQEDAIIMQLSVLAVQVATALSDFAKLKVHVAKLRQSSPKRCEPLVAAALDRWARSAGGLLHGVRAGPASITPTQCGSFLVFLRELDEISQLCVEPVSVVLQAKEENINPGALASASTPSTDKKAEDLSRNAAKDKQSLLSAGWADAAERIKRSLSPLVDGLSRSVLFRLLDLLSSSPANIIASFSPLFVERAIVIVRKDPTVFKSPRQIAMLMTELCESDRPGNRGPWIVHNSLKEQVVVSLLDAVPSVLFTGAAVTSRSRLAEYSQEEEEEDPLLIPARCTDEVIELWLALLSSRSAPGRPLGCRHLDFIRKYFARFSNELKDETLAMPHFVRYFVRLEQKQRNLFHKFMELGSPHPPKSLLLLNSFADYFEKKQLEHNRAERLLTFLVDVLRVSPPEAAEQLAKVKSHFNNNVFETARFAQFAALYKEYRDLPTAWGPFESLISLATAADPLMGSAPYTRFMQREVDSGLGPVDVSLGTSPARAAAAAAPPPPPPPGAAAAVAQPLPQARTLERLLSVCLPTCLCVCVCVSVFVCLMNELVYELNRFEPEFVFLSFVPFLLSPPPSFFVLSF